MHKKFNFRWGLRARLRWESLQRSPDLLAVFNGPTSKGMEGERKGMVKEEEGKRGAIPPPKYFGLVPPLVTSATATGHDLIERPVRCSRL